MIVKVKYGNIYLRGIFGCLDPVFPFRLLFFCEVLLDVVILLPVEFLVVLGVLFDVNCTLHLGGFFLGTAGGTMISVRLLPEILH